MNQGEQNKLDQIWFKALGESVAANEMFTRYRFAAFVANEERESCAKLLDDLASAAHGMRKVAFSSAAEAIRNKK
jgi:hypothetical protein